MKNELLMKGDLFLCLDGEEVIIVSIMKIDDDIVRLERADGHIFNTTTDFLIPIPITPKILEKVGFIQKPDGWLFTLEDGIEERNYIFIHFGKDCNEVQQIEISIDDEVEIRAKTIRYIHQLQHALHLCNIDKLPTLHMWAHMEKLSI